ncbi:hypothetical protein RSOLAG1IB_11821 [Rhizoctonia solani AG-1 IB]|uniref:Uncharacterized protein n=1 Tax=Thanatephorus cucumeris (strain AG1-IB / isolate 7/3/14) TaxID=1108050 RepID=M5CFZ8_THACB|nr:hypothetical protein BN14_09357 [Rhizoctonia solani AG-1 IB]CEL55009.1 hypothetical protein RSOLAG1IB_11821 [Rhizoctonia solani AG-1 IB]
MAPAVPAYPRIRPVMRPPPDPSVPSQESDFGLFQRHLPNPFEPRIPRTLVPETQLSQLTVAGGTYPRPVGRVLVPETQSQRPVSEIDLTLSSQPIYVASSQPSQTSTTSDKATHGQLKHGKAKQPTTTKQKKSAKGKGKEPECDPTPEGDAHPGKKRRVEVLTQDDIALASIQTVDQHTNTNARNSTDRAQWSSEDILKHVTHWFSDKNFTYAKNNQAAMYRQESEDLFKKHFTPQQIKDLHTRLLFKYQVANQVLSKTGGGDSTGDSENKACDTTKAGANEKGSKRYNRVKKRLLALGFKIGPSSIIEFSRSEIYEKMDSQLRHCPETVKSIDMNPAREMTPTDNEDNGTDSDCIVLSDSDDVEIIPGPVPPRKGANAKSGKQRRRANSEDSTLEILATTVKGMGDSHKSQSKMLQGQLAVAREELAINRARNTREDMQINLNRIKIACEIDAHQTQKTREALQHRINQTELVARWQASDSNLLKQSAADFIKIFNQYPLETLLAPPTQSISNILSMLPAAPALSTDTVNALTSNNVLPVQHASAPDPTASTLATSTPAAPAPATPAPATPALFVPVSVDGASSTPLPPVCTVAENSDSKDHDPLEESSANAIRRNTMLAALAEI